MSVKRITLVLITVIVLTGFIAIGIQDAVKTKDRVNFQDVELKSKATDIQQLNVKYDQLNEEMDRTSKEKEVSQQEVERLRKEKEQLDKEKEDLKAQLQAKIEAKSKLAVASETVVNTATATQTVSAAAAPVSTPVQSSGSVEDIVRRAAVRNGLDPDWFVRLAMCESTMNPNAVNYNYNENGFPSGLFQHISGYWPARAAQYGYAGASVFNAEANANVTAQMWKGGSHLWECQ